MDHIGNSIYTDSERSHWLQLVDPVQSWVLRHELHQGLGMLWEMQTAVSAPLLRGAVTKSEVIAHLRTYTLALFIEVGEFVNELAWKPWKPNKPVDLARVLDEFADILAFIGVIMVLLIRLYPSISTQTIADAYITKTQANIARFVGNVDGYVEASDTWTNQ